MFALSAYPLYLMFWTGDHYTRHVRAEIVLIISTGLAFVGAAVKLASFINHNENGLFVWFMVGHACICFATAITFIMTILVTKYLWRDAWALVDSYSAISYGLILSLIITAFVHTDDDRFFTKVERAASRNFWVMVTQLIIFSL